MEKYPDPDPLEGEEKLEFYGQRPLRVDAFREAVVIQALQYREKKFNHSVKSLLLLIFTMTDKTVFIQKNVLLIFYF